MLEDTIAAVATPLGEGGLSVVRLSGNSALAVADAVFRPSPISAPRPSAVPTHTVHYGHIVRDGRPVDEVLLTVLRGPRTFTREDTVEIGCHGGMRVTRAVLDAVLAAGARLAGPGEFTRRAFLNGRIDLAQAEAVLDLIHARTGLALAAAQEQLAGGLSRRIHSVCDALIQGLAHVEAFIDFPDEDIQPDTLASLAQRLRDGLVTVNGLLASESEGRVLRRGVRAALIGRPNAGKSSLLNALLGRDRAIVSPVPGTTRDTIEETADIRGIPVVFIDTAGLRESLDPIEREGVRRTESAARDAELVLHVVDGSEPWHPGDAAWMERLRDRPLILVRNKCDLPSSWTWPDGVPGMQVDVSSLTGSGVETLRDAIRQLVWSGRVGSEMLEVMINARHADALRRAREGLQRALDALEGGATPELVALDWHIAVNALGEVVGRNSGEELLDAIFGQFCLGK